MKNSKTDFEKLSSKFKELRSLAINYKNEKEVEIKDLRNELNDLKIMVEESKNSYEKVLDKATESIEKFIKKTENSIKTNIQ